MPGSTRSELRSSGVPQTRPGYFRSASWQPASDASPAAGASESLRRQSSAESVQELAQRAARGSRRRRVSFHTVTRMVLVPLIHEYGGAGLKERLWYGPSDIAGFKRDAYLHYRQHGSLAATDAECVDEDTTDCDEASNNYSDDVSSAIDGGGSVSSSARSRSRRSSSSSRYHEDDVWQQQQQQDDDEVETENGFASEDCNDDEPEEDSYDTEDESDKYYSSSPAVARSNVFGGDKKRDSQSARPLPPPPPPPLLPASSVFAVLPREKAALLCEPMLEVPSMPPLTPEQTVLAHFRFSVAIARAAPVAAG